MSLRAKLIAAIVCLPGAILLLAILLISQEDRATPPEAIVRVIWLAMSGKRADIGPGMLDEVEAGHFAAAYVLREAGSDVDEHPREAWTVRAFYAEPRGTSAPDVTDPAQVAKLFEQLREAHREPPPIALRRGYLAVAVRGPDSRGRSYAFVLRLHEQRKTAQAVYWVMVGGIVLLIIVFTLLITTWVIRPLRKLSTAADRIADGDFGIAMEPSHAPDEFGRTFRALNRMASEIGEYQGQLEERVLAALGRIKKTEQHLVIAQRLAATGKLAAGLAHEINNPLGGMKNAVNALCRGDLSEEKTALYLDLVADGLGRVEQTVKKFLTYTPRRVEPQPTDLADVVGKSVALAKHRIDKFGILVETTLPVAGEAIVFGDPHELQQVALNLLLNAADAIGPGHPGGAIFVEVARQEHDVVLRVRDNGGGMSPDDQDRCFDMFFTTKEVGEGSGMGLAVAHNVVSNHGGRIELSSHVGEGSSFEVILPAEARPPEDPPSKGGAAAAPSTP